MDDIIVFSKDMINNQRAFKMILRVFKLAYGVWVNFAKIRVLEINVGGAFMELTK